MDFHKDAGNDWIGSLVKELSLANDKDGAALGSFRTQMEECKLSERIRQTVTAVNREVGYQALYLLEFLPPRHTVLHLLFYKNRTEYIMDIVLRAGGPVVVFHSINGTHGSWERYLYGCRRLMRLHIAFRQKFKPALITNETMRAWFSFLLSGFDKRFKSGMETGSGRMAPHANVIHESSKTESWALRDML